MTSLATIEEATAYMAERLETTPWDDASEGDQQKALNMATRAIDKLAFIGDKYDDAQEHEFPRGDDTTIPQDIKDACCELALSLLDGVDPELEFENLGMVSMGYSNVRTTYDRSNPPEHIIAGIPSVTAWRCLKPYLRDPRTIDLSRA